MRILVCPLSRVHTLVDERRPDRVVSVLDPAWAFPDLGPEYEGRHLRLSFHDAHEEAEGVILPAPSHVEALLAFLSRGTPGETLLVHCRAGIGRSTATAFVAACHRWPAVPELVIANELRRAGPLSRPNETLVRLADEVMGRRGRMSAAIEETGRGLGWIDVAEGVPFVFGGGFDLDPA